MLGDQQVARTAAPGDLPRQQDELSTIANTGSAGAVLTVLNTRCRSRRKTQTLSTRSVPLRPHRVGSSAWLSPSVERSIIGIALDKGVCHPGHLGGHGGQCLAPQISVEWIFGDVAHELLSEVVLTLAYGHLAGHPERASKSRVTILGELALTTEAAGLVRRQIEATELQELTIVSEATQIAGFGKNRQGMDRPDARKLAKPPVIGMVAEQLLCLTFYRIAMADKLAHLLNHQSIHLHSSAVDVDRQRHRASGGLVNV